MQNQLALKAAKIYAQGEVAEFNGFLRFRAVLQGLSRAPFA
jgi:hypothetical protein